MGKDREIAFSTFLKLLALPAAKQRSALQGFFSGGGYDYWRPLRELAAPALAGDLGILDVESNVSRYAKAHQLKYNTQALTNLIRWFSQRNFTLRKNEVYLVKKFGNAGLRIRIAPELALSRGPRKFYVHLWATNNPVLTDVSLSMGLRFFEFHTHQAIESEYECLIFDAVKGRLFNELEILGNVDELLASQREQLSALWNDISSSKESPGRPPSPERRPRPII